MGDGRLQTFVLHVKRSFEEVMMEFTGWELSPVEGFDIDTDNERKVAVIIGITGTNKGRILLETPISTAGHITEAMNQGPLEDSKDLYMYMAEFANIFCGRAITYINNQFKDGELRLTPPAIFSGSSMVVTTPNVKSICACYSSGHGNLAINVGFEGV